MFSSLSAYSVPSITSATVAIRMMAIIQGEQDLHEVVPYCFFRYRTSESLGLLEDSREVASSTILHDDIQNAVLSINVAVMIAYNMFVMEVLEDISVQKHERRSKGTKYTTDTSATICFLSRSDMRSKRSSFLAKI